MAISITINGSVTLDESAGLQNSGVGTTTEDNNDSDISLATLLADASTFYTRLFDAGELNLSNTFATAEGVARSATNYISLSGTGSVISLGFTTNTGAALPIYGVDLVGAACNLTALDGGAITLFADPASELGSRVVYGVDTQGDIVFAMYMQVANDLLSARVWMVQFEALDNPVDTNHDDPLAMTGLGVGAGTTTEFDFDELPSGANLFGMLGSGSSGLIVFGTHPVLKNDGTYKNPGSDVIQTSQGGINATIGINSQMFDTGESAYFTFVRNPDPNYTSLNLSPNEADDADNLQYGDNDPNTNDLIEASSAFLQVSQIQSGAVAGLSITAYNLDNSPKGRDLLSESGENPVAVTRVIVYAADHQTVIDDSTFAAGVNTSVSFSFSGSGVATVTGIEAGYWVEWYTTSPHDQVKITGTGGKFDVGGFGLNEAGSVSAPLTGVRFEDDGPTVNLVLNDDAQVTVDESDIVPVLGVSDTIGFATLFDTNTADYGTDGAGTDGSVYELLLLDTTPDNLRDTLTDQLVVLSVNSDGTLITGSVNGGADVVFTIELDPLTEEITLTQYRAMVNPDASDPDESSAPLTLDADTIHIQRTLTDGDDDSASDEVDISAIFKFEDDGPALPPATQGLLELVTDDTNLTPDSDTLSTDDIFTGTPDFGNDGPNQDDPITYALRLVVADPLLDPDSGLVDTATGKAILLKVDGNDIVGIVDEDDSGTIDGTEALVAIRYSLSTPAPLDLDTEDVTFTQYRAVEHDDTSDPNESTSPETINGGLVFIDQTAIDGDGDVSDVSSFDLGAVTQLLDDGPAIGPVANSIVDFEAGNSANQDLNGDVGNDPNASPYKITSYTASLTVDGVELHGILSNSDTRVTYWADTGNNGTFGDAGDTAYYRLDLGDQGGIGDYTFTVLVDPQNPITEFRFDDLPSGSNLFGIVGDSDAGLIIFGKDIVLKADNTYIANQTQEIKTSQAGLHDTIGIESQMFDPGDAAYFTFVNDPDPNFTGTALGSTEADDADNIHYGSTHRG